MGKLGFIIMVIMMLTAPDVGAREARGAIKRKSRHVKILEVDIEDLVRAEADPNFDEFVKERERQQKIDEQAVLEHKQARQAFEDEAEKGRQAFIQAREKQQSKDELDGYDDYIERQNKWYGDREIERQKYVIERNRQITTAQELRQARLQKAFPNQRMPAAIEEPKYPAKSSGPSTK